MASDEATPKSLLDRLHDRPDGEAWGRFAALYTPLLLTYMGRLGVPAAGREDAVQDVLVKLVRWLAENRYDPGQRFRGLLFRFAQTAAERLRGGPPTLPLPPGDGPADPRGGAAEIEEAEYRTSVLNRALRLIQTDFDPATWQAFWKTAVDDRPAADVGAELGLSVAAVYQARSRVRKRLGAELRGLLD